VPVIRARSLSGASTAIMFSMLDHFRHDPADSSSESAVFGEQRVQPK
jgi:hypothetical protein